MVEVSLWLLSGRPPPPRLCPCVSPCPGPIPGPPCGND